MDINKPTDTQEQFCFFLFFLGGGGCTTHTIANIRKVEDFKNIEHDTDFTPNTQVAPARLSHRQLSPTHAQHSHPVTIFFAYTNTIMQAYPTLFQRLRSAPRKHANAFIQLHGQSTGSGREDVGEDTPFSNTLHHHDANVSHP